MNSLKNLLTLISAAIFGVITLMEIIVKKSGFTSAGFIISVIMLLMMLVCRFVLVTKYKPENRETIESASQTLKDISLPLGFIGGLTVPLSIVFAACTVVTTIAKFITLPDAVMSIVNAAIYIVIAILPLAFSMGLLCGKYGNGTDFMFYSIGLMVYIASRYFLDGAINPFVCSQLILSLSLWDMTSGLMRKEPPATPEPKQKKEKKSKKNDKKEEVKEENKKETEDNQGK